MTLINIRPLALILTSSLLLWGCTAEPISGASASASPAAEPALPAAPLQSAPAASARTPDNSATEDQALAVEGEGIRLFNRTTSAASPIPFGRPHEEVLAALEPTRGPATKGKNQDCGAGPVEYASWPDGLSLIFQNGDFAGWGVDGRSSGAITTAIGIGPSSSRAELENAYADVEFQQTSLGTEFAGGGFSGVLDGDGPNARITDIWAGVSCVAR